ncbi:MAG: c-type cytochrome biogenesis protein CcsB [Oscillospiraceae bacterium]|nr:c-type cytochrome biogenesis protein CcsB [Oscillospiraceae bacterium]
MNVLFFVVLGLYFAAVMAQFAAAAFKKEKLAGVSWAVFIAAFALHTLFLVLRGAIARRLPMSNQFEFANAFAWGIALLLIVLRVKVKAGWLSVAAMPAALLILSYAALQPREITELMPALRSAWFGIHIGSAVFAYAAFVLAGCVSLRYLRMKKQGADELQLQQMDYLSYRLVGFGFLFLTVVILSGAIWAEQAWSAFWTWDPKETWALITWIIYAVYLHLRLRRKKEAAFLAWYLIVAIPVVLFTFAGVNTLLPGLHSYA